MFLRTIRHELLRYVCSSWPARLSPACLIGVLEQRLLLVLSAQCLSEDQLRFTSQTVTGIFQRRKWLLHRIHACILWRSELTVNNRHFFSLPVPNLKMLSLRCSGDVASAGLILLWGINIIVIIIINHHLNKFFKDVLVPEPSSSIFPGILHLNLSSLAPNVPSADLWIHAKTP